LHAPRADCGQEEGEMAMAMPPPLMMSLGV